MKKLFSLNFKNLIMGFVMLMSLTSAGFAAENMLNAVEISQNEGVYELRLKTEAPVEFRKKIENKDSVYFELKNISADEKIDTIYNDVQGVDGVVIQQIDKSKLRIYVNAANAASTKLITEAPEIIKNETKEVVINRPMSEYAPILGEEKYQEKADWENNGFNTEHLLGALLEKVKNTEIDYTLLISICVVIASIVGLKKAFSKVNIADEPLIGITPNNRQVFEDLNNSMGMQNLNPHQELIEKLNKGGPAINYPKEASVPQTLRPNSAAGSYGINSYQKVQNNNPYQTKKPSLNQMGSTISQPQRKIVTPSKQAFTTNVKKPATIAQNPSRTGAGARNIENIKFLESVTKIYEQSGRKDLANGLKANLNKSKIAM